MIIRNEDRRRVKKKVWTEQKTGRERREMVGGGLGDGDAVTSLQVSCHAASLYRFFIFFFVLEFPSIL